MPQLAAGDYNDVEFAFTVGYNILNSVFTGLVAKSYAVQGCSDKPELK